MNRPWVYATWLLAAVGIFTIGQVIHHDSPHADLGPAVTIVTLTNGQDITCITVGTSAVTCDWSSFVSGPNYGAPK